MTAIDYKSMYLREKKQFKKKKETLNYDFEFLVTIESNFNIELYNVSNDILQKIYYIPNFLSSHDEQKLLELVSFLFTQTMISFKKNENHIPD